MRDVTPNPNVCPACAAPWEQFLPWQVLKFSSCLPFTRPKFAIICRACKEIVGYEVIDILKGRPEWKRDTRTG